ncbi:MAG: hypothetical protein ACJ78Y_09955 [Myxococcales bacterium]
MTRPPEWGTVAQKAWTSGSQSAAEARKSFFNRSRRPLQAVDISPDLSPRQRRMSPSPALMPLQNTSTSSAQGEAAGISAVAVGVAAGGAAASGAVAAAGAAAGAAGFAASSARASAEIMIALAATNAMREIDM